MLMKNVSTVMLLNFVNDNVLLNYCSGHNKGSLLGHDFCSEYFCTLAHVISLFIYLSVCLKSRD